MTIKEGKMKIYRRVPVPLQSHRRRVIESHESWRINYVALYPSPPYISLSFMESVNLSLSLLLSISAGVHTVSANLCDIFINQLRKTGGRFVEEDKGTRKRTEIEEIEAKRRRKKEKENRKLPHGIIKYAPRENSYLSLESIITYTRRLFHFAFLLFSS